MKKILLLTAMAIIALPLTAQELPSPTKRGLCYNSFTQEEINVLNESRVTWTYNWAQSPNEKGIGPKEKVEFMPMIWGAGKDLKPMVKNAKKYLSTHKDVKCLLGFNEPMMKNQYGGCELTPTEAALAWPQLEALAKKYNVKLAAPALTWGFEPLSDGKIYGAPEQWMDEFIKVYKENNGGREPVYDYIVLHSYMDYPSAVMWFCDKYSQMYNRQVLLTEFCAWDQDPYQTPHQNPTEQMWTMSQKVEAMEKDPNVAGYAWFMSHANVDTVPYNSVFQKIHGDGSLTDLGKIYLYMSDFSGSKKFSNGERIPASEYIYSSNYNTRVGTKPEDGERFATGLGISVASDAESAENIPLELSTFTDKRYAAYPVNMTEESKKLSFRILSDDKQTITVKANGKEIAKEEIPSTNSQWATVKIKATVPAGESTLEIESSGSAKNVRLYWLMAE